MNVLREAAPKANLVTIQRAQDGKMDEYRRIFDNSALYNHYFKKDPKMLDDCISSAIANRQAFVAVDRNGTALGWATIMTSHETVDGLPELFLLGVKDTARGRGIGQMLLHFYEEVMVGLGFHEIGIVVNDWNPRARKLYDSFGYKLRKSIEDPYIGGFEDHILVKKI